MYAYFLILVLYFKENKLSIIHSRHRTHYVLYESIDVILEHAFPGTTINLKICDFLQDTLPVKSLFVKPESIGNVFEYDKICHCIKDDCPQIPSQDKKFKAFRVKDTNNWISSRDVQPITNFGFVTLILCIYNVLFM